MTPALWAQLLERHGLTEDYIDRRYDLILHLVTAADGAEEFYTTANNAARTETAEQARKLDQMIEAGYVNAKKKGYHARIDNSTDFKDKLRRATAEVVKMLEND